MIVRVLTALVLIPVVLGALFYSAPWAVLVLVSICAAIGATEIARLLGTRSWWPLHALLALSPLPMLGTSSTVLVLWASLVSVGFLLALVIVRQGKKEDRMLSIFEICAGLWVTAPLMLLVIAHALTQHDKVWEIRNPVLYAIVPLWIGDSMAIFAGKAFGKTPLAPTISPKKTVEGGVANLLGCLAGGFLVGWWTKQPIYIGLLSGIAAGLLGQAGDLFESWVKRRADVKDSGTLLPGHGGILDRIDSILFTAPAVTWILLFTIKVS